MIVRFNSRGRGGGSGPANYLKGRDRNRPFTRVLRGHLEITKQIIDGLSFARNYTSGCLSFAEKNIPSHQKELLMTGFENMLLCGLDRDQYNVTWIEHRDKKRLELNFLIANVELLSGHRLQPYYDRADRKRVDSWQTAVNAKFQFSDPNDPANRSALTLSRDLPRDTQNASREITDGISIMAENGLITDRDSVIRVLTEAGFDVARQTRRSISIKNPIGGGRNIRLKGYFYERDFRFSKNLSETLEGASSRYSRKRGERFERARAVCQAEMRAKSEYNRDRYKRHDTGSTKTTHRIPDPIGSKKSQIENRCGVSVDDDLFHQRDVRAEPNKRTGYKEIFHDRSGVGYERIRTAVIAVIAATAARLRAAIYGVGRADEFAERSNNFNSTAQRIRRKQRQQHRSNRQNVGPKSIATAHSRRIEKRSVTPRL